MRVRLEGKRTKYVYQAAVDVITQCVFTAIVEIKTKYVVWEVIRHGGWQNTLKRIIFVLADKEGI